MPDSLEGLQTAGPYAVLSIATAMAWGFNRGRAFVVAATLLGAFAVNHFWRGGIDIIFCWVFGINDHLTIQPDVQYVMSPSGDRTIGDALVLGSRVIASW